MNTSRANQRKVQSKQPQLRFGFSHASRRAALHVPSLHILAAVLLTFMPMILFVDFASATDPSVSREYQLKAAILQKFLGFLDWVPNLENPERREICVLGGNPFGDILVRLISLQTQDSKPTAVREISNASEGSGCSLVFLNRSESERLARDLETLKQVRAVTVSDIPNFASVGGMIELRVEDRYVRFVINLASARQSGIHVSSHLLALAKEVIGNQENDNL